MINSVQASSILFFIIELLTPYTVHATAENVSHCLTPSPVRISNALSLNVIASQIASPASAQSGPRQFGLRPLQLNLGSDSEIDEESTIKTHIPHSDSPESSAAYIGGGAAKNIYKQGDTVFYTISPHQPEYERLNYELSIFKKLEEVPGTVKSLRIEHTEKNTTHYLKYYKHGDLASYSKKNKLSTQQIASIAKQLCVTITQIHQHHIIHKDIKPGNILIDTVATEAHSSSPIQIALGDFDQSYSLGDHFTTTPHFQPTSTTAAFSHPQFLSPPEEIPSLKQVLNQIKTLKTRKQLQEISFQDRAKFERDKRNDYWASGMTILNLIDPQNIAYWQTKNDVFTLTQLTQEEVNTYKDQQIKKLKGIREKEKSALNSLLNCALSVKMSSKCSYQQLCNKL